MHYAFLILFFFSLLSYAMVELDPLVLTTTKEISQVRKTQLHLSEYEIREGQDFDDFLRNQRELQIQGQPGTESLKLHGALSRHVSILIDGVAISDSSQIGGEFNSSLIDLTNVERVEVLRGSQGVLYGHKALGGVINFITKKEFRSQNYAEILLGDTYGFGGEIKQVGARNSFVADLLLKENRSYSVTRGGEEKDPWNKQSLGMKYIYYGKNQWESRTLLKVNQVDKEMDSVNFTTELPVDDNESSFSAKHIFLSEHLEKKMENNLLSLDFGFNHAIRASETVYGKFPFAAKNLTLEGRLNHSRERGEDILGVALSKEYLETQNHVFQHSYAIYGKQVFRQKEWFSSYGGRFDEFSSFGKKVSSSFELGWQRGEQRISLSYGNGFKVPSLYQLYGEENVWGKIGNTQLLPETSHETGIAWEQSNKDLHVKTRVFQRKIEDLIEFQSPNGYVNSKWLLTTGVENEWTISQGALTHLVSWNYYDHHLSGERELEKVPHFQGMIGESLEYKGWLIEGNLRYQSEQFEYRNGMKEDLQSYYVMDFFFTKKQKSTTYKLKITNAGNHFIEQSKGYFFPGREMSCWMKRLF